MISKHFKTINLGSNIKKFKLSKHTFEGHRERFSKISRLLMFSQTNFHTIDLHCYDLNKRSKICGKLLKQWFEEEVFLRDFFLTREETCNFSSVHICEGKIVYSKKLFWQVDSFSSNCIHFNTIMLIWVRKRNIEIVNLHPFIHG